MSPLPGIVSGVAPSISPDRIAADEMIISRLTYAVAPVEALFLIYLYLKYSHCLR